MGALFRDFCGLEAGNNAGLSASSGSVWYVGDGQARTGEFYAKVFKTVPATGSYFEIAVPGIVSSSGGGVKGLIRAYIRMRRYPSTTHEVILGFLPVGGTHFAMEMDTSGHFRAKTLAGSGSNVSAYSASALALGSWYEVILQAEFNDQPAGFDDAATTVTVTGVESATIANTGVVFGPYTLFQAHFGGYAGISASMETDYDDVCVIAGSDEQRASVVLPTQTHITMVVPTAQGSLAAFSGDYRNVLDLPYENVINTDQVSTLSGESTTFTHRTASVLGLGTIAALKVYATAKASANSTHAILIGGVEYSASLVTTYPAGAQVPTATIWSDPGFDATEIGVRNKTGATVSLATLVGEVLHDGSQVDLYQGTGAYRHAVGTYVGDGAFQAVAGVGFNPQMVWVKPLAGAGGYGGIIRHARTGGTRGAFLHTTAAALFSAGVLTLDPDGFTVGPHVSCNEAGTTYVYLAVQEGGQHAEGEFFRMGTYLGDALDNRNVVIPGTPWAPAILFVFGSGGTGVLRTKSVVGDLSAPLGPVAVAANMIQAFTPTGFQLGTSTQVNGTRPYVYVAWKASARLDAGVRAGAYMGSGGSGLSIPDPGFPPAFVVAKAPTAVVAYWRGTPQVGLNSTQWTDVIPSTTALIALTATGFSVGTTLSVAGQLHYWVVWSGTFVIPPSVYSGCPTPGAALAGSLPSCQDPLPDPASSGGAPPATVLPDPALPT